MTFKVVRDPKNTFESQINLHYLSGFNDALMLVLDCIAKKSWEEAIECFDFSDRQMEKCGITQNNLNQMRKMLEEILNEQGQA